MGEFGWAYVKGAITASGPTGSLQFRDDAESDGNAGLTGSAALVFLTGTAIDDADGPYELRLKGTLNVQGETWLSGNLHVLGTTTTISASNLIIADPVIGLGFGTASAHTGAAGDRGFIFGLRTNANQAMFWDESSASFIVGKVGEQAPSKDPGEGAGADYDVPGGDFSVLKVGGLIASGTAGARNSGFIFGYSMATSGDVEATGALSGGLGYFNKAVQMADTLRVSGTTIFGAGQGGALGPSHTTHHQLTGALYLTSSQASKISGSLSSSGELFGYSLRTSGDLNISGAASIKGNTTLGDASGDTATINAQTIVLANVAAGTDNTVLVYNGSSIVTDEIDSRVWGSTLLDASGTPADNQVAIWTDANTAEGQTTLTFATNELRVGANAAVGQVSASTVRAQQGIFTTGSISGALGYFTDNVQMASTLRTSGTTVFGAGQGGELGPSDFTHHQMTGALYLTSSNTSKISGSLSSSGEIFAYSIKTSGDITCSGSVTATNLVDKTGTPVDNQVAIWQDSNTVEGFAGLTLVTVDANNNYLRNIGEISASTIRTEGGIFTTGSITTDAGTISGSRGIFTKDFQSYGDVKTSGSIKTDTGTISGSRGIFTKDFQSYGDVKTSGSVTALGALSGGLGYFNKQVNMANNLRVSGTAFLGHGQAPVAATHHQMTGALFLTSSHPSKFSGSLSSSLEVFGYSLRTSGDLNATGSIKTDAGTISGSQGIFTKDVQVARALYVSGAAVFNDAGGDNDFRIESDVETHMFFLDAGAHRISIGDSVDAPAATLEVTNHASAGATGVPLVQLNSNDVDKEALDINASNTTANVIDASGLAVTTHAVAALSASALTSGQVIAIDHNDTATTSVGPTSILVDFDKTGVQGNSQNSAWRGLHIMQNDAATNHAGSFVTMKGIEIEQAFANNQGVTTNFGLSISGSGADNNVGINICVDDTVTSPCILMSSSLNVNDKGSITVGGNGAMTIQTIDLSHALADLKLDIDGIISASAANGANPIEIQASTVNIQQGGLGVHTGGGIVATSSIGVNTFSDPTSLKVSTGGGEVVTFGVESATFGPGKVVYFDVDGGWKYTDADAVPTAGGNLLGVCLGDNITDGVLLRGFFHFATASVHQEHVTGSVVYLSTEAADITFNAPTGGGDIVRVIGYATDQVNLIYFNPSGDWIEL